MEVLDERTDKNGNHATSAAAFVEGGIQDTCDDSCSICLEEFCDNDPSTVPEKLAVSHVCMQQINLKDPTSQELFQAVKRERSIKNAPVRIPAIFHHPTLGDFELQHFPVGANDPDLEERIIQHLDTATATARTHHLSRRDGHRGRSAGHGQPHFLLLSHQSSAPHSSPVSSHVGGSEQDNVTIPCPSIPVAFNDDGSSHQIFVQSGRLPSLASGSRVTSTSRDRVVLSNRGPLISPPVRDGAGPLDFLAFSESLKSKWSTVSVRYKESLSKSTQGWRDRFFPRNASMADQQDTLNRREVNSRVNLVSHLMNNLEIREDTAASVTSKSSENSANVYSSGSTNHCSAKNSLVEGTSSESCTPSFVSS